MKRSIQTVLLFFLICMSFCRGQELDLKIIDSCRAVISPPSSSLKEKSLAHIEIAERLIYVSPDSSKYHLDIIMNDPDALATLAKDTVHQHFLTYCYYYMGVDQYGKSLEYAKKVKDLVFRKNIKSDKINSLLVLSYLYTELQDDDLLKSISSLEDFCTPVEDEADANGYVMAKNFLSRYYRHQNRLDTALTILFNLIDTEAFESAPGFQSGVYQAIALYLDHSGDLKRAKIWYENITSSPDFDQMAKAGAHLDLGKLYVDSGEFKKVAYHVAKADSIGVTIQRDQQKRLRLLAAVAIDNNEYKRSIEYINQAREVADDSEDLIDQITDARLTSEAYFGLGAYQKAKLASKDFLLKVQKSKTESRPGLIARSIHIKLKSEALLKGDKKTNAALDSLWTQQLRWSKKRSSEASRSVAVKYETDKVTAENELLKIRSTAAEAQSTARQKQLWLTLALLTAVAIGMFFAISEARRRRKLSEELKLKNNRITWQNAETNHRTNHYLTSIIRMLREQQYKMQEVNADTKIINDLERQTLVYTKLQSLLFTDKEKTVVNLKTYFKKLLEMVEESHAVAGDPLQLEVAIDELVTEPDLAGPLAQIVNELITNSVKYARRTGGVVRARFSCKLESEGILLVRYEDDGADSESGTSGRYSSESGLELIDELTVQLEGEREKTEGYGYVARFEL